MKVLLINGSPHEKGCTYTALNIIKEEFIKDPMGMYENKIFCKGAPLKSAVVWNEKYIDFER